MRPSTPRIRFESEPRAPAPIPCRHPRYSASQPRRYAGKCHRQGDKHVTVAVADPRRHAREFSQHRIGTVLSCVCRKII